MWAPELFSASALERVRRRYELEMLDAVPYYAGLMTGEHDALIQAFAGAPVVHDPRRGRIVGVGAFTAYVRRLSAWLAERDMTFDPIEHPTSAPRGFEEVVLHLDGVHLRADVPVAIVAQRDAAGPGEGPEGRRHLRLCRRGACSRPGLRPQVGRECGRVADLPARRR